MGNKVEKKPEVKQSPSDQMFDMIFEFKTIAKQMKKESTKADNKERQAIMKVKEAIEKNLPEAAKMHATDAIRMKNESKRYLILSSKLDAVYSRLQAAYNTQRVNICLIFS
jgi:charged multivesicular body protein 1